MKLKPSLADLLPIAVSLALSALPFFIGKDAPQFAAIYRKHERIALLPLNRDTTVTFESDCSAWKIEILDAKVAVIETNCPKKICLNSGSISRAGSSIICAPGGIAVVIEGGDLVDATTR